MAASLGNALMRPRPVRRKIFYVRYLTSYHWEMGGGLASVELGSGLVVLVPCSRAPQQLLALMDVGGNV